MKGENANEKVRIDMEMKIHYTDILPKEAYEKALKTYGGNLENLKQAIIQHFQLLFTEEIEVGEETKAYVLPDTATLDVCDN